MPDNSGDIVFASFRPHGGRFGQGEPIGTAKGRFVGATTIDTALGPRGEALVSWVNERGGWYASRQPGRRFGRPVQVTGPPLATLPARPRLAIGPDGRAAMLWSDERVSGKTETDRLKLALAGPSHVFGAPITLTTYRCPAGELECGAGPLRPAFGPRGALAVGWQARFRLIGDRFDRADLFVSRRTASGRFERPRLLSRLRAGESSLGFDSRRALSVVWVSYEPTTERSEVDARVASWGKSYGRLEHLGPGGLTAELATDSGGTTVAAWLQGSGGGNFTAMASDRPAGARRFSRPRALSRTGENVWAVQIAAGGRRTSAITWLDGQRAEVVIRRGSASAP